MTEQEKNELLDELMKRIASENLVKENKNCLKPTLAKYCNVPDVYTSKMREAFDGDGIAESAVWDCIRKIVCKIMRVKYVREIKDADKANEIADEICALVVRLAEEMRAKDENISESSL